MGLRPTQGDEKRALFSNYCCWKRRPPLCHLDRRNHGSSTHPRGMKNVFPRNYPSLEAPPSPLSSRPDKSWAVGPPKVMKNAFPATTVAGSAALPFVISTEAQRSGEICGVSGPSLGKPTERTRISYFALLATSTCAPLRRESRMQIINATGLHRKPEGA